MKSFVSPWKPPTNEPHRSHQRPQPLPKPDQSPNASHLRIRRKPRRWTSDQLAQARGILETNAAVLAELRQALTAKRFRYGVDYSQGFDTKLIHLSRIKRATQLLKVKSAFDASQNDSAACRADLADILKLAETLNEEPTVIGWLVRGAVIRIAVDAVERQFQSTPVFRDADCRLLQTAFRNSIATNYLPNALIGERAMALSIFNDWRVVQRIANTDPTTEESKTDSQKIDTGYMFLAAIGFLERDGSFYTDAMDRAIALGSLPPPQSLALTNYMGEISQTIRKTFISSPGCCCRLWESSPQKAPPCGRTSRSQSPL
jgi:hypothetical protein